MRKWNVYINILYCNNYTSLSLSYMKPCGYLPSNHHVSFFCPYRSPPVTYLSIFFFPGWRGIVFNNISTDLNRLSKWVCDWGLVRKDKGATESPTVSKDVRKAKRGELLPHTAEKR